MKVIQQLENGNKRFKCLELMFLLYMTVALITTVLAYKLILIHGVLLSAVTFIVPLGFALNDTITEVYGYSASRRLIWYSLLCEFIFTFVCYILIVDIRSDPYIQQAYLLVFGGLPRLFVASLIAITVAGFINIYLLSKWKILIKGNYFMMRSFGASFIGLFIFTLIISLVMFVGRIDIHKIFNLVFSTYLYKIIALPFVSVFAGMMAAILKYVEGSDAYDYKTSFNPFSLE